MTTPTGSIVSAACTAVLVAIGGAMLPDTPASAADDCVAAPKSTAPQGQHWYYRTDRKAQRKCWYLGPQGLNVHKAAPQAAQQVQPAAEPPAPPSAEHADNAVMAPTPDVDPRGSNRTPAALLAFGQDLFAKPGASFANRAPVEQPAPQGPPASPPGDAWNATANALLRPDPLNPIAVVDRMAPMPSAVAAQVPPEANAQATDEQNVVPEQPPAVATIQSNDPATSPPWRVIVFVVGVLAAAALVLSMISKILASWRQRFAGRPEQNRRSFVVPKWAPSRFDIKAVPPLAPIGHVEQSAHSGELLRKLLRDVERSAAGKAFAR